MRLYWCTTTDHEEDWFVVAASARDAAAFHEAAEGYYEGLATAELVARLPDACAPADACQPNAELLRELGAQLLRTRVPRVVRFGDRVFAEGVFDPYLARIVDGELERRGPERPKPNGDRA